ncbi:MAG: response regulator [Planctomycetes bacterium]|nr:response regulator [Planctomycetota bacterium]
MSQPGAETPLRIAPPPAPEAVLAVLGRRQRNAFVVGTVVVLLVVVGVGLAGGSALLVLPVLLAALTAIGICESRFGRLVFSRVDLLETARRSALAEATSKAQFLANMSHEIRTPMNGILGMAELLTRTRLDAEQEQMATTIQASAEALLTVLNDILDFSKIEAGKLELEVATFDAWQLVDDCAGLLHATADQKGVELMTYIDPRLSRSLTGDSARVRQVVLNFLTNAVKFTIDGEVVLGVDLVTDGAQEQTVRFWVRDTGVGISQEAIGRLFSPFAQADASTTRRFGGTGLGLTICRRLAEMMGGRVEVTSEPGKGSTFSFFVTLAKGDSCNARPRPEDVDLTGHSVLIVDDNETNRQLMVMQLTPTRIGIDVASNAISAIEVLRHAAREKRPFSMAILDMAMPGIDGMQLALAIRNDPEIPLTPVALASSLGTRPGLSEMAEADIFRWLNKPLSSGRLLQVVRDMAGKRVPRGGGVRSVDEAPVALVAAENVAELPVLVAEDNEINRRVLAGMLQRIGCQVTFAVDGREAVQLAGSREFALILMDCQMPELDGYEATKAIRAKGGPLTSVPIIALTANVLPSDREACLQAGMNDFLGKPVKLDVLRACVQRWGRHLAPTVSGAAAD